MNADEHAKQNSHVVVDLRHAYDDKVCNLAEIEIVINHLMQVCGRNASLLVLRDSLKICHLANAQTFYSELDFKSESGKFLAQALLNMAKPKEYPEPPELWRLKDMPESTQVTFTWLVNYRRQKLSSQDEWNSMVSRAISVVEAS